MLPVTLDGFNKMNLDDLGPVTPVDASAINTPAAATIAPPDPSAPLNIKDLGAVQSPEDYYGSTGQQIKAGLEGAAQGVLGPIAPAIEKAFGVKGSDILGRQEANPITHGVGEAAGLIGGAFIPGLEEANLGSQVGKLGEAAKLATGAEGLAATGIKAGAELSALAGSTELSKAVEGDPNQTLGSAAINIGLSGIIGGAGGVALGSVSPLWNKVKNVTGAGDLISDFINETAALQQAKLNPEAALSKEFEAIPASDKNRAPGVLLARWAQDKGAAALGQAAGESTASLIGAGLGTLVGHPFFGAYVGEKTLGPILSSLAKPLAENALDSTAAKSVVDYLVNVSQGQKILSDSVSNMFKNGTEIFAKDLIPDQESRDKLDKSLEHFQNPENALQIGGGLQHYLPSHATAAAQTASQAANYLAALKPKQPVTSPLDTPPPTDKFQQAKYNRALDIAQQPLMALKYAKEGTLLPQDITTLQTIYPGVHAQMGNLITNELIKNGADKTLIPYGQKVSMSMLLGGTPLEGTMTQGAAQAIIGANAGAQTQAQQQAPKRGKSGATEATLKAADKVNSLYATPLQQRQLDKRS